MTATPPELGGPMPHSRYCAISAADRRALLGAIIRDVGDGLRSPGLTSAPSTAADDVVGDGAAIETLGAPGGDGLERRGERRIGEDRCPTGLALPSAA